MEMNDDDRVAKEMLKIASKAVYGTALIYVVGILVMGGIGLGLILLMIFSS